MMDFFKKLLGMPPLASENGHDVDRLIIYIHWLMIALFIGWLGYFLYTIWRFSAKRSPKADHHGVRSHVSNYAEIIVAGIEVLILVAFAIPFWANASDVTKLSEANKKDAVTIQVLAQQFNWNVRYTGKDGVFGKQDMRWISETNMFGVDPNDPAGKDDVQISPSPEIHLPVNKAVIAYISSKDVIHSFKVLAMRVTQDAIPGMRIPTWFKPTQKGRYQINCAQLCGNGHSSMSGGFLVVEDQADYDAWLAKKSAAGATPASFE
jgi:cytochrome c oxidase subunit 2